MNLFQKLYHWLTSEFYIFFALRPVLGKMGLGFDLDAWSQAVASRNIKDAEVEVMKLADIATKGDLLSDKDAEHLRFFAFFLYQYTCWLVHSKRVFAPSAALVDMLMLTESPPFKVGEIKYVFTSFAVQLEKPIVSQSGIEHSLIMVSFEDEAISFSSIDWVAFEKFSPLEKGELAELFRVFYDTTCDQSLRDEATRKIEEHWIGWCDGNVESEFKNYTFVTSPDMTYLESLETNPDAVLDGWADVLHLVIGLNLYLQTDNRTAKVPGRSLKEASCPELLDSALMDGAELVELALGKKNGPSSKFDTLLEESLELVRKGKVLTGVHIRLGHWRRFGPGVLAHHPGGHQVWIKPTLVKGSGTVTKEGLVLHFRGLVQKVGVREEKSDVV